MNARCWYQNGSDCFLPPWIQPRRHLPRKMIRIWLLLTQIFKYIYDILHLYFIIFLVNIETHIIYIIINFHSLLYNILGEKTHEYFKKLILYISHFFSQFTGISPKNFGIYFVFFYSSFQPRTLTKIVRYYQCCSCENLITGTHPFNVSCLWVGDSGVFRGGALGNGKIVWS